MAETDLTITLSSKDVNVIAMINKIVKGLNYLESEAKDTSKKVVDSNERIQRSFENSARAAGRFAAEVSNRLRPMAAIGGQLLGIFGVAGITGAIYKSIGAISAFEDSMTEISTLIAGDATEAIKVYSAEVRKLSKDSGKSTQELSKGLYQVISAGTKGTETAAGAMELLNVAQQAATAGVSNTFAAVDVLTTVLNAYNTTTKDSAKFSDILFTTVKLGKTTFNELAGKIGVVASTAAGAGVSFEDLNAAIAALTKGGLGTDIAISGLNSLIVQMVRPSKELESAVKGLGKGYKNVSDLLKKEGLAGSMRVLNQLTGGSTEKIVKLIPSIDALKAASILAGTGMEAFNASLKDFQNAGGSTAEAYQKMAKTFSFLSQQIRNKMELMFEEIGAQILPKVIAMLQEFGSWFEKNSSRIIKDMVTFVETVMKLLSFMVKNAGTIVKVFATIWMTQKLAAIADGIIKITLAIQGLNLAMLASGGKIALLLAGIAAVMVGINAVSNRAEEIQKASAEQPKKTIRSVEAQKEALAAQGWPTAENIIPGQVDFTEEQAGSNITGGVEEYKQKSDAEKKVREAALKYLHDFEVSRMTDRQKLFDRFEQERQALSKQTGLSGAEREKHNRALNKAHLEDLAKFDKEAQDKKDAHERKIADEVKKAGIEYHEQRMEWLEKEDKAKQDSEAYLQELSMQGATEEQKLKFAYEKDLIKIRSMTFENEFDRLTAINLRTKQFAEATEETATGLTGFFAGVTWKKVGEGFAEEIGKTLLEYAVAFADFLTAPISALADTFTDLMGSFSQLAAMPFDKISEIFAGIMGGANKDVVKEQTEGFVRFIAELGRQLPAAIQWFAKEGVPMILDAFIENLPALIDALVESIPKILNEIISRLDQIILPLVEGILKVIPLIIDQIPLLITKIAEMIPKIIVMIVEALPSIIGSIGTGIVESVGGFFKGLATGIADIFRDKDKAEKAEDAKQATIKEAIKQGKTPQEAEALGQKAYDKVMGRLIEGGEDLARLEYNKVYKKWMDTAKTRESIAAYTKWVMETMPPIAKAAGWTKEEFKKNTTWEAWKKWMAESEAKKAADAVMGAEEQGRGDVDLSTQEGGYDAEGNLTTGEGVRVPEAADAYFGTLGKKPEGPPPKPIRDPKVEAQKAYDAALKAALDKIAADWAIEADFMLKSNKKTSEIKVAKKTFETNARAAAYDAARAAYEATLKQVEQENRLNPEYEWAGVLHSGGYIDNMVKMARAIRAHSGASIPRGLAPDEVPIIAQAGEAVMNRNWVQNAGGKQAIDRMNQSGQSGGGVVNNVYVEHMMSNDTAQVIDGMINNNLKAGTGKLYEKFNTGRAVGYKTRRAS